ncbi:MAG: tetratricopeptide repeat protein [Abditibacteriaceae bacterium]
MKTVFSILLIGILACALQVASRAQSKSTKQGQAAAQKQKQAKIDLLWKQSDEAFHNGNYPLAISYHKAIVALDPHDVESYSDAAWLMWSLGHGDEAQQHINRGIAANLKDWNMWDAAGQQDDLQKYFSKAEFAFSQAVKFIPAKEDSQMLRRRWAHAAENAGNIKTAIGIWQQLVKNYPNEAVNKNNLNRILHPQSAAPVKSNLKQAAFWPVKVFLAPLLSLCA